MTAQLFLTDNTVEIISKGLIYYVFFCQVIMSGRMIIQTFKQRSKTNDKVITKARLVNNV